MKFDATSLGVETTLASDAREPAQGQAFKLNGKAVYALWGLSQPGKPSLKQALASQATGDARIADLKISVRSKFTDILISVLTAGIIVPRSVTFEGVVVSGGR